ncbi:MAG TPA: DUF1127 domain-containing protein [Stellaceae bacterium]|nr:DUF1127 domain-containing protein [Stellaceae bacterium]
MVQALKKPIPGLTAAHLAAFTTVSAVPELHAGFGGPVPEFRAEVFYPQWWRNPAIVMRGWQPRAVAQRRPWSERIGVAATAVLGQVRASWERWRSREALLRLDDRALRDIGIDRATAQYLGSRPFWLADD